MFKPRLRIPRGAGAPRLSSAVPRPAPLSPFAVTARHQQQQQRSLHASPSRRLHKVAPLTDDAKFEQYGVPGLLTTEGFEFAYTNYQSWLLEKLNQMTAGIGPLASYGPMVREVQGKPPRRRGLSCRRPTWPFSTSPG